MTKFYKGSFAGDESCPKMEKYHMDNFTVQKVSFYLKFCKEDTPNLL